MDNSKLNVRVCNGQRFHEFGKHMNSYLATEPPEGCQGLTKPVVSPNNPPASEWYCEKCRISYAMSKDDLTALSKGN